MHSYIGTYIHMLAIAVSYVCETIPAPQLLNCVIKCLERYLHG